MNVVKNSLAAGLLALVGAATGCQFAPRSQLKACEVKSRSLNEQSQAQLSEIANLKSHAQKLENQLLRAEEELAMVDERVGVDRKRLSNYEHERQVLREEIEDLAHGAEPQVGHNRRLADLARRHPTLKYDSSTGACKFETDVLFESGQSSLKVESRQALDQLAEILGATEARDLRVMVVGHTDDRPMAGREARERHPDNWHLSAARALNVADYLQKHGLREEQVGVAGFGRHEPIRGNGTAEDRHRNRRVEIFVMSPDTPIVGWIESHPNAYR